MGVELLLHLVVMEVLYNPNESFIVTIDVRFGSRRQVTLH